MTYLCKFRGCERFSDCPLDHRLTVIEHSDPDENTGEPLYFAVCDEVDHTVTALTKPDLMPDDSPGTDDKAEQNKAQINAPDLSCLAKEVITEIRKQPLDTRLVDVAPSAGKSLRAALKDPGGRPKKTTHGAEHYTQKAFAAMLNTACNCKSFTVNIIHDWEHGRSEIPFAWIDGERMTYSAEIRKFPSKGNNRAILEAIIKELKTGHWVAKSVLQKDTRHFKSAETLAKANGQVATAIRERSQLKYEK